MIHGFLCECLHAIYLWFCSTSLNISDILSSSWFVCWYTIHYYFYLVFEVFVSNIFYFFFIIAISLLNFSSMLLTFLSRSWIDFPISFMCLFESSWGHWLFLIVSFWILYQIFQPIHYQLLSCWFWREDIALVFIFKFLLCDLCIYWLNFSFISSKI
jgi:hypothetical protein